jgi:DNA-binding MarR family transcriptional regulator
MKSATAFIRKVAANPSAYPDQFVAIRRDTVAKILSGQRSRLLDVLEVHGPYREVQQLAAALKRKPSAVARDVKDLEAVGLVERRRHGRRVTIAATRRPVLIV